MPDPCPDDPCPWLDDPSLPDPIDGSLGGNCFFEAQAQVAIPFGTAVTRRTFPFFRFLYVLQGSGWIWTENLGRTALQAADLLLVAPGQPHDLAAGCQGMTADHLCAAGPLLNSLAAAGLLIPGLWSNQRTRRLLPLIEQSLAPQLARRLPILAELTTLATDLFLQRQPPTEPAESKIAPLIRQLQEHPERVWDGPKMAEFCQISEVQLRRIFKQETGMSPKRYLDEIKMKRACELLKSGFAMGVVAELLGFNDPFHFSRRFKEILGVSPREYLLQC